MNDVYLSSLKDIFIERKCFSVLNSSVLKWLVYCFRNEVHCPLATFVLSQVHSLDPKIQIMQGHKQKYIYILDETLG